MSEVVVDTNVWVKVDEVVSDTESDEEKQCIISCQQWLEKFITGDDRLVVDHYDTHSILTEYRNNVRPGGVAENLLNELTGRLFHRLVLKTIQVGSDGYAILPSPFHLTHHKDRVFVAVAIQCNPYAIVHNATDSDWAKDREFLIEQGLTIHELCPDYIAQLMAHD